jgi:hypothetical protein
MDRSLGLKATKIFLDLMEEWKKGDGGNTQAKLAGMIEYKNASMINHFKKGKRILGFNRWERTAEVFGTPLEIFILGDPSLTPKQNRQIVERLLEMRRLFVKDILT